MSASHALVKLLRPVEKWDEGPLEMLVGEVLSFTQPTLTVPCTAEVDFEGAGNGTTCLSCDSYTYATTAPASGDIILALTQGQDTYIIDRIS